MTEGLQMPRVIPGGRLAESDDHRVSAVLDVLGGGRLGHVAEHRGVDPALLHRWVQDFVEAGTAQVTHQPAPDVARQRDRFLSVFTHGLRSPLALAQAWTGLLGDLSADERTREQAVVKLQSALDLLDERTQEVELLTAAMLGRGHVEPRSTTVGELVAGFVPAEQVTGAMAEHAMVVDPDLIGRVLRDLWAAASTTSPLPDRVWLEVPPGEDWHDLRVVRAGRPIDPALARALFEPFDSPDGQQSGVTVGLYLARALAVVHGGTMGMEQDDDHAVLWVRVPLRTDTDDALVSLPTTDHPPRPTDDTRT